MGKLLNGKFFNATGLQALFKLELLSPTIPPHP